MDPDAVKTLTDGIFSKALQVRRMLHRGATELIALPLAELAVLAERTRTMVSEQELERASAGLASQRWRLPTVETDNRDGYARWSSSYDEEANPLIALEEPAVLELLGDVAGKDVLDAACGTGRYAIRLAQAGARVSGVDVSEEMLALAKRKRDALGPAIDLRRGDVRGLPFPDSSFDLVLCALALCHVPELEQAIRELARVVRPGGRLIITDFHPFCLLIGWRTGFQRPEATYHIENHLHLTQEYLKPLLDAGLTIAEMREEVVDERLLPVLSQEEMERFRGWPAALLICAEKKEAGDEG
jgi:ubiquinone/menaquinone biosynthesis C-methylase UbiE